LSAGARSRPARAVDEVPTDLLARRDALADSADRHLEPSTDNRSRDRRHVRTGSTDDRDP
jgi:hypothetical protein